MNRWTDALSEDVVAAVLMNEQWVDLCTLNDGLNAWKLSACIIPSTNTVRYHVLWNGLSVADFRTVQHAMARYCQGPHWREAA